MRRRLSGLIPLPFSRPGEQYVSVGQLLFPVDYDVLLLGGRAIAGTAPQGADLRAVVKLDGAPFLTLTCLAGFASSGFVDGANAPITAGSSFTVDVEQVGSTIPGSDLVIVLWMRSTP